MPTKIASLHIYPLKSCRAIDVNKSLVERRGLIWDRRAMIVDGDGRFLTQRTHPKLARIGTRIEDGRLAILVAGQRFLASWSGERRQCIVWNDTVDVECASGHINHGLSEFLGQPVTLVRMDEKTRRKTSGSWADTEVSLSDGYPLLVTTTGSLSALAKSAAIPLDMAQFRPNIVIDNKVAWQEDCWRRLRIAGVEIELVKPCTRCQVTTLNPLNGLAERPETMQAMIRDRRSGDNRVKGVLFGWNAIIKEAGTLTIGDKVEILETRQAWPMQ